MSYWATKKAMGIDFETGRVLTAEYQAKTEPVARQRMPTAAVTPRCTVLSGSTTHADGTDLRTL
jgi:hypothetical protein